VKVFPASLGGPHYLRELRGPFREVPLLPTGGVTIDDADSYLKAGALAVGVGGALLGDALDGGDLAALRDRALRLLASVSEAGRR
jgi:2-dehydro-3-deoxyphosphogluconate aldolase/(4S)-4-hydroxy-2-oxoglutarate aldolase